MTATVIFVITLAMEIVGTVHGKRMSSIGDEALETPSDAGKPFTVSTWIVVDNSTQREKLRLQKTEVFRSAWPVSCDGKNLKNQVVPINTNGYRCDAENGGRIHEIVSPVWQYKSFPSSCCQRRCMHTTDAITSNCMGPFGSRSALADALGVAAVAVAKLEMNGKKIDVETQQDGIHDDAVVVEVPVGKSKLPETLHMTFRLLFKKRTADFETESENLFVEFRDSIATFLGMKLSSYDNPKVRVLVCPHAGTSQKFVNEVVQIRAKKLRAKFIEANILDERAGEVGQPWAHCYHEGHTNFRGFAFGVMVYKFYDSSKVAPKCTLEDLHLPQYMTTHAPYLRAYRNRKVTDTTTSGSQ